MHNANEWLNYWSFSQIAGTIEHFAELLVVWVLNFSYSPNSSSKKTQTTLNLTHFQSVETFTQE
jgi:transposase